RLGASTTPANCDIFDSSAAAADTARAGSASGSLCLSASGNVFLRYASGDTCTLCTASRRSTKSRYPLGVGTRPEDVCGLGMSPKSPRSPRPLRIVPGARSTILDNVGDPPAGRPQMKGPTGTSPRDLLRPSIYPRPLDHP